MACKISKIHEDLTKLHKRISEYIKDSDLAVEVVRARAKSEVADRWAESSLKGQTASDAVVNMKAVELSSELNEVDTSRVDGEMPPWDVPKGNNVWGMRASAKQAKGLPGYTPELNFGNPFMTGDYGNTPVEYKTAEGSNELATAQYYYWLTDGTVPGNYKGDKKLLDERRNWILGNLALVNNADVVVYKGTAAGSKVNHVTALMKIAENKLGKVEHKKLPKTPPKQPAVGTSPTKPANSKGVQLSGSLADQITAVNKGKPAEKHTAKELKKVAQATQYIGKGSPNSSTARYAEVYGDKANTGKYTSDDVVWVSSNGRRNGRVDPLGPNGIKDLLDKAIDVGATIVMDTENHINKTGDYNIGEAALAAYMKSAGYTRDNSSGAGVWTKKVSTITSPQEESEVPWNDDSVAEPMVVVKESRRKVGKVTTVNGEIIEVWRVPTEELTKPDGTELAAVYNSSTKTGGKAGIYLNDSKKVWNDYFNNKNWTNPRVQKDGSAARAIRKDAFGSIKELRDFVIQHEVGHNTLGKRTKDLTIGEYESKVNEEAARVLGITLYDNTVVGSTPPFEVDEVSTKQPIKIMEQEPPKPVEIQEEPEVEATDGNLTEDQQAAADRINKMIKSKTNNMFVLEGEGGTGKSYTVGKVIADSKDTQFIVGAATAHAAKDVISDFIEDSLTKAKRDDVNVQRMVAIQLPTEIARVSAGTVVVLDEISMINNSVMKSILDAVKKRNGAVKIVLLGDRAQLRPVETQRYLKVYGRGTTVYFGGEAVKGYIDNNEFHAADGLSYPVVTHGNDMKVDNQANMLKAKIFKDINALGPEHSAMLKSQKRQKDKEVYNAIRSFRTEVIEETAEAENSSKYREQLAAAKGKTFALKNVNSSLNFSAVHQFMYDNNMVEQLRTGEAAIIAPSNAVVNQANSAITAEFAKQAGQYQIHQARGNFEGQVLRTSANIFIKDVKITNNSEITIDKIKSGLETNDPIKVATYTGTELMTRALASEGISEEDVSGAHAVLNISSMPTQLREALTIVDFNFADTDLSYIVFNEITQGKLNRLGLDPSELVAKYGSFVIEYETKPGEKETAQSYFSDIIERTKRNDIVAAQKDEVDAMFNNLKPVYAMTAHKSQGKSFKSIIADLKFNQNISTVGQLELAYVALTRSKGAIQVMDGSNSLGPILRSISALGNPAPDSLFENQNTDSIIPTAMTTTQDTGTMSDKISDKAYAEELARNIKLAEPCIKRT